MTQLLGLKKTNNCKYKRKEIYNNILFDQVKNSFLNKTLEIIKLCVIISCMIKKIFYIYKSIIT